MSSPLNAASMARKIAFACFALVYLGTSAAAEPPHAAIGELDEGGRAIIERMAKDLAGAEASREFRRLPEREKNRLRRRAAERLLRPQMTPEAPAHRQNDDVIRGVEI